MTNLDLPGIWVMDPDAMEERIRERYLTVEEGTAMSSIRISLFQDLPGSLIEFDNGDMAWADGDIEVLAPEEP